MLNFFELKDDDLNCNEYYFTFKPYHIFSYSYITFIYGCAYCLLSRRNTGQRHVALQFNTVNSLNKCFSAAKLRLIFTCAK